MKINYDYNKDNIKDAIALSIRSSTHIGPINRFFSYYSFVYPVAATIIGILLIAPMLVMLIRMELLIFFADLLGIWTVLIPGGILCSLGINTIYFTLITRRKLIKFHLAYRFVTEPGTFEFTQQGVISRSKTSEATLSWETFARAVYNDTTLLLYVSTNSHLIFPKKMFTEQQWQELMHLVHENIKNVQKLS